MKLSDFDYPLPKELIAQKPLAQRDASRLLVVDRGAGCGRAQGPPLQDKHFYDIVDLIPSGDVLVLNDTKVFPARIFGRKKITQGKVDLLLLEPVGAYGNTPVQESVWRCLVQPSIKEGQEIIFEGFPDAEAVFLKRDAENIPLFEFKNIADIRELAGKIGQMPLPPYIKRETEPDDQSAYQTVFAETEGAVAAPTAGLHFTKPLLKKLEEKGVEIVRVTLHVGYGTFKPVEDLENHRMHAETFELSAEVAEKINRAKSEKRKIWAVGTTSLRVLETCVQKKKLIPGRGKTDLYIKPPFRFEAVDCLITNFHLPKTTLLLLVSAFMDVGAIRESPLLWKKAYDHAVRERYRFYSYGDAMLIL